MGRPKGRANGLGSVYKDGDRYVAAITVAPKKRHREYFLTRPEAERRLAEMVTDYTRGELTITTTETVAAYLASWLEAIEPNLRPRVWQRYGEYVHLHAAGIQRVKLSQLSAQHLQRLYAERLRSGLSPTTVNGLHRVLHRAFAVAVRQRLLSRNPADDLDAPRKALHHPRTLSVEEARRFLAAAQHDPLEALYVLAITTGMRQGELRGLRWADVALSRGTITVRQTVTRVTGKGWHYDDPKTAAGRHTVRLTRLAVDALTRHRARLLEERLAAPEWHDEDLVFPNTVGRPLEHTNLLRRSFLPLLERAGLPPMRFHELRHTAATLLLSEGTHPRIVADLLGHSQIGVTLNTYSHVMPTMQQSAADTLDGLLSG